MNALEKIPFYQRKKNVPAPLKGLELKPFNEDFGKMTKPIIGKDDRRPTMGGNYFDKEKDCIVGTDAHKLYHLYVGTEYYRNNDYEGIYYIIQDLEKAYRKSWAILKDEVSFDTFKKDHGKIDGKYPNWEAVVPKDYLSKFNVDLEKLWWYATVVWKSTYISNDPSLYEKEEYHKSKMNYVEYEDFGKENLNRIVIKAGDEFIAFNAKFLSEACKFILQQGFYEGEFRYSGESRPALFNYKNHFGSFDVLSSDYVLLMPVLLDYGSFLDGKKEKDYAIVGKGENVVYDIEKNEVYSNGSYYAIDEELGFKSRRAKKAKPQPKNEDKKDSDKELITKKLKVLNLLLKTAKGSDKELIEKKIKVLNLINK